MVRKTRTAGTSKSSVGLVYGFRSGLEKTIASQLEAHGIDPKFESIKLEYVKPATNHKYTPDFPISKRILIETKGRFMPDDRAKHLLVKEQHPHLDIRFVFNRSASPLYKGSKTTYAMWCDKHGFKYADKSIPEAWLKEIKNENNSA